MILDRIFNQSIIGIQPDQSNFSARTYPSALPGGIWAFFTDTIESPGDTSYPWNDINWSIQQATLQSAAIDPKPDCLPTRTGSVFSGLNMLSVWSEGALTSNETYGNYNDIYSITPPENSSSTSVGYMNFHNQWSGLNDDGDLVVVRHNDNPQKLEGMFYLTGYDYVAGKENLETLDWVITLKTEGKSPSYINPLQRQVAKLNGYAETGLIKKPKSVRFHLVQLTDFPTEPDIFFDFSPTPPLNDTINNYFEMIKNLKTQYTDICFQVLMYNRFLLSLSPTEPNSLELTAQDAYGNSAQNLLGTFNKLPDAIIYGDVLNIVIFMGGSYPLRWLCGYFDNFTFKPGETQVYTSSWEGDIVKTDEAKEFQAFGSVLPYQAPSTYDSEIFDDPILTVSDLKEKVNSYLESVTLGETKENRFFYETDYEPDPLTSLNENFFNDLLVYSERYSYFRRNTTLFYYDPREDLRPTGPTEDDIYYLQDMLDGQQWYYYPSFGNVGDYSSPTGPANSQLNWYGYFECICGVGLGVLPSSESEYALPQTNDPSTRFLTVFHYKHTKYKEGTTNGELINLGEVASEGVDQSHDSTEVTESVFQYVVDTFGIPFSWFYKGRLDSNSIDPQVFIDQINSFYGVTNDA